MCLPSCSVSAGHSSDGNASSFVSASGIARVAATAGFFRAFLNPEAKAVALEQA